MLFREDVAGRLQLEAHWWSSAREGLGSMCACLKTRVEMEKRNMLQLTMLVCVRTT